MAKLQTTVQVCERLGVTKDQVMGVVRRGKVPEPAGRVLNGWGWTAAEVKELAAYLCSRRKAAGKGGR